MGSQVSPAGRRIVKPGSDRTKSAAKLKEVLRNDEDGLAIPPSDNTRKTPSRNGPTCP